MTNYSININDILSNTDAGLSWVNEFDDAPTTRYDIIAVTPSALDAIALGADEFEVLCALADASPRALSTLASL